MLFTVDLELTNRCNATCRFCPRAATPHQGLMRSEVFDQALTRIVELRDVVRDQFGARLVVSLCGMGEPLLHRDAAACVTRIRDAGLGCVMSSNGALLDERRGRDLVAAGLQAVFVNVGEQDDAYEQVYGLPFGRTCENVIHFARMSAGRCTVGVVLVQFDDDPHRTERLQSFWRARGIENFVSFDLANRGGALDVEGAPLRELPDLAPARAAFDRAGVEPRCSLPFEFPFIAYDGQYHLCASDWRRMAPLGSVFDRSLVAVTEEKLGHVRSRRPVCRTCSLDPTNRLAVELQRLPRGSGEQEAAALVDAAVLEHARTAPIITALIERSVAEPVVVRPTRTRIPVHIAKHG
jgi:MoaA/NifB/PqqE/SkfB family radical SAM enzyme